MESHCENFIKKLHCTGLLKALIENSLPSSITPKQHGTKVFIKDARYTLINISTNSLLAKNLFINNKYQSHSFLQALSGDNWAMKLSNA